MTLVRTWFSNRATWSPSFPRRTSVSRSMNRPNLYASTARLSVRGVYSVAPGETLRDIVRRAGGFTPNAYIFGSEFTRESTRVFQQQRLDEYVQSLELADSARDAEPGGFCGFSSGRRCRELGERQSAGTALQASPAAGDRPASFWKSSLIVLGSIASPTFNCRMTIISSSHPCPPA